MADEKLTAVRVSNPFVSPIASGDLFYMVQDTGTTPEERAITGNELRNELGYPTKHISGFTYSNNGTDATNDIDITAGTCRDSTDAVNIVCAALTKRSDAAWAVGSGNGWLDTGAVGNSDYYIWAIKRSDTGVTDSLCSLSSTAPTMPASYDYKRLVGWFKRVGGTIVLFDTYEIFGGGLEFNWRAPTLDISLTNTLTTSRRTDAVKVPLNFSVIARMNVYTYDATTAHKVHVYCPDQTDAAVAGAVGNLASSTAIEGSATIHVRTSSAGLIALRASLATVDFFYAMTQGFQWGRRN